MYLACKSEDPAEIVLADVNFHQAILEASTHTELFPIWLQLCAGMRFTYTRLTNHMDIFAEHQAIIDAYDAGNKQAMIKAIEENLI